MICIDTCKDVSTDLLSAIKDLYFSTRPKYLNFSLAFIIDDVDYFLQAQRLSSTSKSIFCGSVYHLSVALLSNKIYFSYFICCCGEIQISGDVLVTI